MRLRRLVACSLLFALLPAGPAFAGSPSAPTPAASTAPAGDGAPDTEGVGASGETPAPAAEESPATAEEKVAPDVAAAPGELRAIVELAAPDAAAPVADQAEALSAADVVLQPQDQPFIVVSGTGDALAKLADDPRVLAVRRDRQYQPSVLSSVKVIGGDQAHAAGVTGAGQTVAVVDTGIDRDHPFFAGRIVAEACFSARDESMGVESLCPNGEESQIGEGAADAGTAKCLDGTVNMCDHGSHVAGIAAGKAVEGAPGSGVAPDAGIIAVQIFSRVNGEEHCGAPACVIAFESSLRLALDHIAELTGQHRIAAVNLSLGGDLSSAACDEDGEARELKTRIDDLLAKGTATVVAAGNESFEGASVPGCISSAVTVGATDDADAIAPFSNRGPLLDLFAPGVHIDSAVPDNAYGDYSGTSMSAPHVAGAFALLRQKWPDAAAGQLVDLLRQSGRPIVYGPAGAQVTTPRIDVYGALSGRAPQPPITSAPDPDDPLGDDPTDRATPTPSKRPTPAPVPDEDPTPVPLPTVTVTVTVTITPTARATATRSPQAQPMCTRGTARKALTAAQWAAELKKGDRTIPDSRLLCYLRLVQKAGKVFPEMTKVSTLASARKVIKLSATTKRARLDSALLTAWLNWAHGARDITAKVHGSVTLKAALTAAEQRRMNRSVTGAQLAAVTAFLRTYVNAAK